MLGGILGARKGEGHELVEVLQDVQEEEGYISEEAVRAGV